MFRTRACRYRLISWGVVWTMALVPVAISCPVNGPVTTETVVAEDAPPATPASSNPTRRLIQPRKHQSLEQQLADQAACYEWTCGRIGWDPYEGYDDLVADGYAVALTRRQLEQGLVCLAAEGAVTGALAGDLVGNPEAEIDEGAELGAAIAVAMGVIRTSYLIEPDDPAAQRAVARYERNLRKWDAKYGGCLRRKGYRVP